ncbi:MAG: endo alpha-1,4 polygalactosaminidase [Acidimicrobiia bacterium]|nr:endo alpha-1,4 polygalactosaminidase [Acidimicrobiia bacterium]
MSRSRPALPFVAIAIFVALMTGCSSSGDGDEASDTTVAGISPTEEGGGTSAGPDASPIADGWWEPTRGLSWQWQLQGEIDTTIDADVYDLDITGPDDQILATLKGRDIKLICYFSVGSWEDWRPDAADFPDDVLGNENGWPGERWLDISNLDALRPIYQERIDTCAERGYDAIEPDNTDGYSHDTGFDITEDDSIALLNMLADMAHRKGLGIALKNSPVLVERLADTVDFAVVEQCVFYEECHYWDPLLDAGKAVFLAEYQVEPEKFCPQTEPVGISAIYKDQMLDAAVRYCPGQP